MKQQYRKILYLREIFSPYYITVVQVRWLQWRQRDGKNEYLFLLYQNGERVFCLHTVLHLRVDTFVRTKYSVGR